ncbi:hypothetical protein G6F60_012531 [Rhizopus arrhizus]|nr:hypothetical protein G6F60_012531 [Rhizopus arrhizus]
MTSPLDSRPTFRRGSQSSNIDYIFASHSLHSQSSDPSIDFIEQSWTDHALLSISLKMCSSTQGPGLWLQQTAKSFGRRHVQWRAQQLRLLQRKRNRILREQRNHGMLPLLLEIIERQIGALQQEITANNILRAGRHWRENGETSAGYLKKTISTRASSRYIPSLLATPESEATSNLSEMQNIAKEFYKNLYTCDPVSLSHTEALLNHIPEQNRLAPQMSDLLTTPFSFDDILQASTRSPHSSSPGSDGLPYEALSFLFRFEPLQSLVLDVYNQALESAIFPAIIGAPFP